MHFSYWLFSSPRPFCRRCFVLAGAVLMPMLAAARSGQESPPQNQDRIEVVGRLALPGGSVTRLIPTQHFSGHYVYAETGNGNDFVLIDMTNPAHPAVVSQYTNTGPTADEITLAAGTAAMVVGGEPAPRRKTPPETVKILNFADAEHPRVVREFTGVTAIGQDDSTGLIFLANPEGLWVLRKHLAEDPAVLAAYSHYVLYSH